MKHDLKITEINFSPTSYSRVDASKSEHWEPGEKRLKIQATAYVRFESDPSIGPAHETHISLVLPLAGNDEVPLRRLDPIADEAIAELLEAIAVALRKTAVG